MPSLRTVLEAMAAPSGRGWSRRREAAGQGQRPGQDLCPTDRQKTSGAAATDAGAEPARRGPGQTGSERPASSHVWSVNPRAPGVAKGKHCSGGTGASSPKDCGPRDRKLPRARGKPGPGETARRKLKSFPCARSGPTRGAETGLNVNLDLANPLSTGDVSLLEAQAGKGILLLRRGRPAGMLESDAPLPSVPASINRSLPQFPHL